MAKGGFPGGFGGGNMNNLMKQAQKMQQHMMEMQKAIEEKEFVASVGGGMVTVSVNGKKDIQKVSIDPEVVDPEDVETLEDMILGALKEAMAKADEETQREMSRITGGMNIPGMF